MILLGLLTEDWVRGDRQECGDLKAADNDSPIAVWKALVLLHLYTQPTLYTEATCRIAYNWLEGLAEHYGEGPMTLLAFSSESTRPPIVTFCAQTQPNSRR